MYAVSEGGFDKLFERLLEKGADPNAKDPVRTSRNSFVLSDHVSFFLSVCVWVSLVWKAFRGSSC